MVLKRLYSRTATTPRDFPTGDRVVPLDLRTEKTTALEQGWVESSMGGERRTRDKGDFEQLLLNVAALINHRSEDSNGIFLRSFLCRQREGERERTLGDLESGREFPKRPLKLEVKLEA